jgi:hypothetical protein
VPSSAPSTIRAEVAAEAGNELASEFIHGTKRVSRRKFARGKKARLALGGFRGEALLVPERLGARGLAGELADRQLQASAL